MIQKLSNITHNRRPSIHQLQKNPKLLRVLVNGVLCVSVAYNSVALPEEMAKQGSQKASSAPH